MIRCPGVTCPTDTELSPRSRGCRTNVIDLLEQYPVPLNAPAALQLPDGTMIFSRAALENLDSHELQQLLQQESAAAGAAANGSGASAAGAHILDDWIEKHSMCLYQLQIQ